MKDLQDWLGRRNSRSLRAARCRRCKATVATGLSDDIGAFRVTVDPTPLTALGEAHALLTGLHTFTVTRMLSGGTQITLRTLHRRRVRRAHDIWPEHRCGQLHIHVQDSCIPPPEPSPHKPGAPAPF